MFADVLQLTGLWFLIACAVEALAVIVEQWGAARSPDEDAPKHGAAALLTLTLSLLTPGLLLAHGFLATQAADQTLRIIATGAPVAAVLGGALVGAVIGAVARRAAPSMRKLALPLDLAAFAVAVYATLPSIRVLLGAASNGGAILTP